MNNKRINVQTLHCNQMSKDLLKIHQEVLSVIKQNRINLSPRNHSSIVDLLICFLFESCFLVQCQLK